MKRNKYTYKYRPEYGSDNYLLEFNIGPDNKIFISDLTNSLIEIKPTFEIVDELFVFDEIHMEMKSEIGLFDLWIDSWGLSFIMSEENQEGIKIINSILSKNMNFESIEVDKESYKYDKNAKR